MGGVGSDAAIEAADIVIMDDRIDRIPEALKIAAFTRKIVMQNIFFALGTKGLFLALGAMGLAGMWEAVVADVGVALVAVLNSIRAARR
jgi:Cd2+/Zn2+-exporting ATPase